MNNLSIFFLVLFMGGLCMVVMADISEKESKWNNKYYQYRIPVVISAEKPGWQVVPIDEKQILDAINDLEELKYTGKSFAYNALRCVERNESGDVTDPKMEAGFFLIETGADRATGWSDGVTATNYAIPLFEENGVLPPTCKGDELTVAAEPGAFHLLRFTASGGTSPAYKYSPIFSEESKLHKYMCGISYKPKLLPLTETIHEVLMQPMDDHVDLVIGGRFVNTPKELSFRTAKILFLVNFKSSGTKHLDIYYQPMGTHFLMTPQLRHASIPRQIAKLGLFGPAAKYEGQTRYKLAANSAGTLWFAANTVKLTPETPAPEKSSDTIRIACAANERESFQLVVAPKHTIHFATISATDLVNGSNRIPGDNVTFKTIEYVPIRAQSYITPTRYIGWIGDPLEAVTPRMLTPEAGNRGFWITVDVAPDTPAGVYNGVITIAGKESTLFKIPLELTVYGFALPEYSPLQCNMGGQYFIKASVRPKEGDPQIRLIDYFGVKTHADLQKIANLHYETMVKNKFTPKNVCLYTPIGMKWDPPPEGLNVDKPGNFFRLYDWDFTDFNKQMEHYVNDLKLNQICILHNNPIALNVFMHLPSKKLEKYSDFSPFVTYAWQSFQEMTMVGYNIDDKHSYRKFAQDITRDQYDHLTLDFFRAIVGNLKKHGWLQFATILIDESHNDLFLKHFLRLMKSDPLTAQINIGVCVQGLSYFTDSEYNGLIDSYIPELDENYNRWEPHYFTDYGIKPDRSKLWNYIVTSSRFAIDAPGINNREIGLDLWQRGASGYLCWETFLYIHNRGSFQGELVNNVWTKPYTTFANGGMSFFYPPRHDGSLPQKQDFTITHSLRMELHREGVDDYEYAWLLDKAMQAAEDNGKDVSEAKAIFRDIKRLFYNYNLWSQNDTWLLDLRNRMAREIESLNR